MRRTMAVTVVTVLLVSGLVSVASAQPTIGLARPTAGLAQSTSGLDSAKLEPELAAKLATLAPGEMTTAIVTLGEQADLAAVRGNTRAARLKGTIRALQAKADTSQVPIRALLRTRTAQGKVADVTPLWISNGISVTATADVIRDLSTRPEVASISADDIQVVPTAGTPEPNLTSVGAPALWNLGYTGAGVVVASLDSGVDVTHPDLASRYRGGTNSWYDPYAQNATPADFTGHGTGITGVMVGGDAGGTSIGMAPGAKWIAAKIFNNTGGSTATAIHQSFQWVLDPDHDPNTADAPQVVNGSWSIGTGGTCSTTFQPDLQALRAANILPVFAAGNYGPGGSTSASPANYPEALAVGAVSSTDVIDSSSSRGPSTCGGRTRMFPDVVAPGLNIRTTDRFGFYQTLSGTSLSAPHVSGALALLLGAKPGLSADVQQATLISTARDLGVAGPDTAYGNGKLDVLAAYQSLQPQPDFAVAVTPGAVSVATGETATFAVTVAPSNGFAADVSLSLSGLTAAQASWTFAPAVVTAGSGSSVLSISTAAAIPVGSYPLTVTATSGATSRTATATLTSSAPSGGDAAGPTSSTLTLVPSPTNGTADASLHAVGDDTATGGSNVVAAEYFVDTVGASGTGTAMSVTTPAPIAALDATIAAATVNTLAEGTHAVLVHARDSAGNWGPTATTTVLIDKTGPTLSAVSATPNPILGATTVTLTGTATDSATSVTRAEWFTGADPGAGNAAAMTVTGSAPWNLSSTIDVSSWSQSSYTLNVRAQDSAGNWSLPATTVLSRGDLAGPATSSLVLTPSPTNGNADASLHAVGDDTGTGGSNVVAAEYFVDTVGANGTGTAMSITTPAPTAALDATIAAASVSALTEGLHTVSVHARDSVGNWGPTATTTVLIDKTGPTLSAVSATPNPTQGATTVTLTASATDSATKIFRGEWFTGADPGAGSATPMAVTGTGPWSLSSTPIDISSWSQSAYTLNVRAMDSAGNWSLLAPIVLNVSAAPPPPPPPPTDAALYFSTFGNTNPPGVGGTSDDADIYSWSGTAYSRVFDASVVGVPGAANVDGYDRVDASHFYLSFSATTTLPGLGTVQDEDVVYNNAGTWSLYFDGSAHGLGGSSNLDLDAISVLGAVNGAGGTLYFSTLGNTNPPGVGGTADDADIYSWNGTAYSRVIDASAAPYSLPSAANVDGFVRVDATHFYLSFSARTTTLPILGTVEDEDVIYYNNGIWSVYFDGTAHGLTSDNLDVDAFDLP